MIWPLAAADCHSLRKRAIHLLNNFVVFVYGLECLQLVGVGIALGLSDKLFGLIIIDWFLCAALRKHSSSILVDNERGSNCRLGARTAKTYGAIEVGVRVCLQGQHDSVIFRVTQERVQAFEYVKVDVCARLLD